MRITRWSRTDQLFLEGVLWTVPAIALLHVLVDLVRALRGDPLQASGAVPDALVRSAELITGPLSGTVVVDDPTTAQYAWDLLPGLVVLVLAAVAARLLLGVVRTLRLGDPFTVANARRLTALAALVVVGGLLLPVLQGISHASVVEPLVASDGSSTWVLEIELWPASVGVLIAFLAEVFSRGARLREDVEGLV
ncbi:MAG: hypothetical protein AVDCRST_MAG16-2981 [uncultured Frankineae bacterium]|uniref:DUF2975 domain-containing protein n=1 Tax=uncultured Frankineae bacterium TaxID=437475 RepID=A0A6J4ML11_9ACTN|nr:MAG: hypothetical protein AVDCRST_MAG16-2981 [uncultured Frankineae bacterium]